MNRIRFIFTFLIFQTFILISSISAQINNEALIPEGYFVNPIETPYGIIVSDEYESTLYLLNNDLEELISAPGCAKYISLSRDKSKIGFKLIDPQTGFQTPAVYDLSSRSIRRLHNAVQNAGQVSFSDDGKIAFTIDKDLFILNDEVINSYSLGIYTNRALLSPDGEQVVYKDENDQLVRLNLLDNSGELLTDKKNGYYNASWSPNGKFIAFQSVDAKVFIFDNLNNELKLISEGENPKWSDDSNEIIFFKKEIDFENVKLIGSEIFKYDISNQKLIQITDTPLIHEMDPSFNMKGAILFHTYGRREIIKKEISSGGEKIIIQLSDPLKIKTFQKMNKNSGINSVTDKPDWEHIHQVWDTRDSGSWRNDPVNGRDQGYLACGATSAMEIVSSYGILPPNPIYTHGHMSNFGKYISDEYNYNNFTYSGFTISPNGRPGFFTGAHGYMWNGGGSPHSNAEAFLRNHGIDANLSDYISWTKVKTELDLDFPYMLCSTSLTSGHIVVAVGQYGDGHTLYCNDPYGDKNAGSYGEILNGKNAIYDWADANTGHITITPVVWGITARYRRTLRILTTYPAENENDVSPSVCPVVKFYGDIDPNSIGNKIQIIDQDGFSIESNLIFDNCDDGIVSIEPVQELKPNSIYSLIIHNGIYNSSGIELDQNLKINFSTGSEIEITGNIIDDFESINDWTLTTSGVDAAATNISIDDQRVKDGNSSAKIVYEFNTSSNGYCRILYSPEPVIGSNDNNSVGMWVFGDNSGNRLEYWFTDSNDNLIKGFSDVVDWTGWKFISVELSNIDGEGDITFNSFAIRQSKSGEKSGKIYFDNLMLFETFAHVVSHTPAADESNVLVSSLITIDFNRIMNKASVESAFIIEPNVDGSFSWTNNESQLIFSPTTNLEGKTEYRVSIDSTAKDVNGKMLNSIYRFSFVTVRTKLELIAHYPGKNDLDVSTKPDLIFKFDASLNQNSLVGNVLFLDEANEDIPIYVDYSAYKNGMLKFETQNYLEGNKNYKVILKSGVADTGELTLNEQIEINFKTEVNKYISGNVIDDFETDADWVDPKDAEGSIGVDLLETEFSLSQIKKRNGSYSGRLDYKFKGVEAVCRIYKSAEMNIGMNKQFGIWVFGDFSNNILEYWFVTNQSQMIKITVDTIDWTGWKLKTVDLSEIAGDEIINFNSIVIKQNNSGNISGTLYFDDMQTDIVLPVTESTNSLPAQFSLSQNYPNPFNPSTTIEYNIPSSVISTAGRNLGDSSPNYVGIRNDNVNVVLKVYDILGREIVTLVNQEQKPGYYKVEWNSSSASGGRDIPSGVYFYRIQVYSLGRAGSFVESKKMILLR